MQQSKNRVVVGGRIPLEQKERIDAIAVITRRSSSAVIAEAIASYLGSETYTPTFERRLADLEETVAMIQSSDHAQLKIPGLPSSLVH